MKTPMRLLLLFLAGVVIIATSPVPVFAQDHYMTRRPINLSLLAEVDQGSRSMIGGFVTCSPEQHRYLIRAIGPTLRRYGVTNPNEAPRILLFNNQSSDGFMMEQRGWTPNLAPVFLAAGAFELPIGSNDSAMVVTLPSGIWSVIITSDTLGGSALLELYDLDKEKIGGLINISGRGYIPPGGRMAPGVVIEGLGVCKLLIRAVGPALKSFGIDDAVSDPVMDVFMSTEQPNGAWDGAKVGSKLLVNNIAPFVLDVYGAFQIPVFTQNPGWATASTGPSWIGPKTMLSAPVLSVSNTGGVCLVEIYATDQEIRPPATP